MWNIHTTRLIRTFIQQHAPKMPLRSPVLSLALFSNGLFLSSSKDSTIKLWSQERPKPLDTYKGHFEPVNSVIVIDNNTFASGSNDFKIGKFKFKYNKNYTNYYNNNNYYY